MKKYFFFLVILCLTITIYSCSDWVELPEVKTSVDSVAVTVNTGGQGLIVGSVPSNLTCLLNTGVDNLLVAGTSNGEIYYSYDNGISWKLKDRIETAINCLVNYKPYYWSKWLILAGTDNGLWESPSYSDTWENVFNRDTATGHNTKICQISAEYSSITKRSTLVCYGSDSYNDTFTFNSKEKSWVRSKSFLNSYPNPVELRFVCSGASQTAYVFYSEKEGECIIKTVTNSTQSYKWTYIKAKPYGMAGISAICLATDKGIYHYINNEWSLYAYDNQKITNIFNISTNYIATVINNEFCQVNVRSQVETLSKITEDKINIVKLFNSNGIYYMVSSDNKLYSFSYSDIIGGLVVIQEPSANQIVKNNVYLKWINYAYAGIPDPVFQLQVSISQYFDDIIIDQKNIKGHSYYLSGLESGKTYYWRLKCVKEGSIFTWAKNQFRVE